MRKKRSSKKKIFKRRKIRCVNPLRTILSILLLLLIILVPIKLLTNKNYTSKQNINKVASSKDSSKNKFNEKLPKQKKKETLNKSVNTSDDSKNTKNIDKNKSTATKENSKTTDTRNKTKEKSSDKKETETNNNSQPLPPTDKSINYSELFKNDLFIGDSITEGLSFYDFLNEKNVSSKLGLTVPQTIKAVSNIKKSNPKRIFLLLGINDLTNNRDINISKGRFISSYTKLVKELKKDLPNSKIYLQSILPLNPKVPQKQSAFSNTNIDKFNLAIKEVATKENVPYINIASVLKNVDPSIYQPDGMHFKSKFYELWLNFLKNNIK